MTRDEAKKYVNEQEPTFLTQAKTKANGRLTYVCPKCGNGSGKTGSGIARNPKTGRYKCFSCDMCEDVVGLWKINGGNADDKTAFDALYTYYGVTIDNHGATKVTLAQPSPLAATQTSNLPDYKEYFQECAERLSQTNYLKDRGIDERFAKQFGLGYDPACPKFGTPTGAIIIPTSNSTFVARNTNPNAPKDQRYRKAGGSRLFNRDALNDIVHPVFIVEGELDAMAIMSAGGSAVGLGSTANTRQLLEVLEGIKLSAPLILALDNDEEGVAATDRIMEGVQADKDSFLYRPNIAELYNGCKDAGEALLKDRSAFVDAIQEVQRKADTKTRMVRDKTQLSEKDQYLRQSGSYRAKDLFKRFQYKPIPTGYPSLDAALGGGLFDGLYIVGAVSSLGKTTFVLQMADYIAQDQNGRDVIIFSLEMSATELIAKSISRHTYRLDSEKAKTPMDMRVMNDPEADPVLTQARDEYIKYADRIIIHEGDGDIGTEQIKKEVQNHISYTGNHPVVIVDYLQILCPENDKATDKQNTDRAVSALKRISRNMAIPVITISSFNRDSYGHAATMTSFKESGAVEYSSDVLLGMQFKGVDESKFSETLARKEDPRNIEISVLKNRNGKTGTKIGMKYHTRYNVFEDTMAQIDPKDREYFEAQMKKKSRR